MSTDSREFQVGSRSNAALGKSRAEIERDQRNAGVLHWTAPGVGARRQLVVTGVSGFLGGHFAERALADGHKVVGICRSGGRRKAELRSSLISRGAELSDGDVLDMATLRSAMAGADCVCHFAAAFRESGVSDEYFLRLNVQGTTNVLKAAAEAGVRRFILCSTAGIYGQRVGGIIDESSPAKPSNIYERSKAEAEQVVRELAPDLGMEYVILRPASVYGPRDERLLKLFRSAAKGRFPLFGPGAGRRHMVHVSDVADAFLRACVVPQAASQELIIAGPRAVPLRQLLAELAIVVGKAKCGPRLPLYPMQLLSACVEDVAKALHVNPPLYRRRMDFYLTDTEFRTARAEIVLGWQPKMELREGLTHTFRSYCEQGLFEQRSRPTDRRRSPGTDMTHCLAIVLPLLQQYCQYSFAVL
jgi:nucleoside-diphosphate-sugar epimerase